MNDTDTTLAAKMAAGLEALARMLRDNPHLAPVFEYSLGQISEPITHEDDPKALMGTIARAAARAGAKVNKDYSDPWMHLRLNFGPIQLTAFAGREQVCERVVTGVETVTKTVKDPAALAAVPEVEVTEEVEIVEWVCSPLLEAVSA